MSKFKLGDRVIKRPGSFTWDDVYVVVFTVKIAGKKFCGVLGPERYSQTGIDSELEAFISTAEKGREYHVSLLPQKNLEIYREPVYVAMTRDQYD